MPHMKLITTNGVQETTTNFTNPLQRQLPHHKHRHPRTNAPRLLNLFGTPSNTQLTYGTADSCASGGGGGGRMSRSGYTPTSLASLITCIKDGDVRQLADELEMRDWDVNQAINGRYALHFAADYGQAEVMRFLLERGARIDVHDLDGVTPLLAAIYEGRTQCVELLLAHGADLTGRTPDGKSYADAAEQDDIKRLLLQVTTHS